MSQFAIEYAIFVFVSALGAIQIGASLGRLDGLLFFRRPMLTRAFGAALIAAAFVWFFASERRNISDMEGGLDANYQGILFCYASLAAFSATLALSSLLNRRMKNGVPDPGEGLDALRKTNYYSALKCSLLYWWKNWPTQMRRYFSG